MNISRPTRSFVDQDLVIEDWSSIEPYFLELLSREINSLEEFKMWLKDQSELEAIIEENVAWRYIKMTIDTKDQKLSDAYSFFISEIQPNIAPFDDKLNHKLNESSFTKDLENDLAFAILFKKVKSAIELYREENISLFSDISTECFTVGSVFIHLMK